MTDFTFQDLVAKRGLDPSKGRLVRHSSSGRRYWERSRADFDHYSSHQLAGPASPFNNTDTAYQFVQHGQREAMFVGAFRILDRWVRAEDPGRKARLHYSESPYRDENAERELYDLERIDEMDNLAGRVIIDWGAGTRSWSQWLGRNIKSIVEYRAKETAPRFPGFEDFETVISDVPALPIAWQETLSSVSGVYLIIASDGKQYVGSAYGDGGFLGRWLSYAETGHGGNTRLRKEPVFDATVRVLKVMDPASSVVEVTNEESRWKKRLGSRAHGLNAN